MHLDFNLDRLGEACIFGRILKDGIIEHSRIKQIKNGVYWFIAEARYRAVGILVFKNVRNLESLI